MYDVRMKRHAPRQLRNAHDSLPTCDPVAGCHELPFTSPRRHAVLPRRTHIFAPDKVVGVLVSFSRVKCQARRSRALRVRSSWSTIMSVTTCWISCTRVGIRVGVRQRHQVGMRWLKERRMRPAAKHHCGNVLDPHRFRFRKKCPISCTRQTKRLFHPQTHADTSRPDEPSTPMPSSFKTITCSIPPSSPLSHPFSAIVSHQSTPQ
jgi:hypothetical protein